jgi:hypothetical protein
LDRSLTIFVNLSNACEPGSSNGADDATFILYISSFPLHENRRKIKPIINIDLRSLMLLYYKNIGSR